MSGGHTAEQELTLPGPPELGFTMLHISTGVLGFTRAEGSEPAPTSVQSSLEPHLRVSPKRGKDKGEESPVPGGTAGSPGHWLMAKAGASRDSCGLVS